MASYKNELRIHIQAIRGAEAAAEMPSIDFMTVVIFWLRTADPLSAAAALLRGGPICHAWHCPLVSQALLLALFLPAFPTHIPLSHAHAPSLRDLSICVLQTLPSGQLPAPRSMVG